MRCKNLRGTNLAIKPTLLKNRLNYLANKHIKSPNGLNFRDLMEYKALSTFIKGE